MKISTYLSTRLIPVITLTMALLAIPAFPQSDSFIGFAEGKDAVNEILGSPTAPCVTRAPAWEFHHSDGAYGKIAAKKLNTDCREALGSVILGFTDEEKDVLTQYAVMIDSVIDAEIPALSGFPWNFALISDSANFGVPYSPGHIILTKGLLTDMRDWMGKNSAMLFVGVEMLVREKVRILQFRKPVPFEKFYRETWKFRRVNPLFADRLMNDNGLYFAGVPHNEWVIKIAPKGKEYIMPALLLRDIGNSNSASLQRIAVTIDSTSKGFFPRKNKKTGVAYKDLRLISQYRKLFPLSEYDYHPAELSADLIAKYLVMKFVSSHYGTAPAAKPSDYSQIDVLMKMVR